MAVYTIMVSLAVKDGANTLVLTPTFGEVDLDQNNSSRIVWVLDDGGTDAHFVLRSGRHGILFDWEDKPGKDVFGTFDVDSGENDFHPGQPFRGGEIRTLALQAAREARDNHLHDTVRHGGGKKFVETDPGDRGDHPIIINR